MGCIKGVCGCVCVSLTNGYVVVDGHGGYIVYTRGREGIEGGVSRGGIEGCVCVWVLVLPTDMS